MTERRIPLEPWPGPWEKWARNYCRKNLWRLSKVLGDLDDLVAECALVYVETRLRYGSTVNTPAQFMRLFQMSVISWFHTLAPKDAHARQVGVPLATDNASNSFMEMNLQAECYLNMNVLLDSGSSELKAILDIFLNAPQEVMDTLRKEASSYSPGQFWNKVLMMAKINPEKSAQLKKELISLLTPGPRYSRKEIVAATKFLQQLVQVKQGRI